MKFRGTRGSQETVGFTEAIVGGLADDGGLFVPTELPTKVWEPGDLVSVATQIFGFFGESENLDWSEIAGSAFNFPTPIVDVNGTRVLELFHGPTAAFKDYGARFLARVLSAVSERREERRTILVATSGDTGGAVASAFFDVPGIDVVILYPHEKISKRQEKQLTCWGKNISAAAVDGTFDDCQRLVKAAFNDSVLRTEFKLTSANSINVGRLVPQMSYYGWSSLELFDGDPINYCIPTGNLGNALACVWAKKVGFPIGTIRLATNANTTVPDFFNTGEYVGQDAIPTYANAMDVGDPSNFERLQDLFSTVEKMKHFGLSSQSVSDLQIANQIKTSALMNTSYVMDPHTACAMVAGERGSVVVSTADPAKFADILEPMIGPVPVPESLAHLDELNPKTVRIAATLEAVVRRLRKT